jgi:hypothetical protein
MEGNKKMSPGAWGQAGAGAAGASYAGCRSGALCGRRLCGLQARGGRGSWRARASPLVAGAGALPCTSRSALALLSLLQLSVISKK